MTDYKKVNMFGRDWDYKTIEAAQKEIAIAERSADTLMVADIAQQALWQIKDAYRKANNPPTGENDLTWTL